MYFSGQCSGSFFGTGGFPDPFQGRRWRFWLLPRHNRCLRPHCPCFWLVSAGRCPAALLRGSAVFVWCRLHLRRAGWGRSPVHHNRRPEKGKALQTGWRGTGIRHSLLRRGAGFWKTCWRLRSVRGICLCFRQGWRRPSLSCFGSCQSPAEPVRRLLWPFPPGGCSDPARWRRPVLQERLRLYWLRWSQCLKALPWLPRKSSFARFSVNVVTGRLGMRTGRWWCRFRHPDSWSRRGRAHRSFLWSRLWRPSWMKLNRCI